jgi:hypothetical protein
MTLLAIVQVRSKEKPVAIRTLNAKTDLTYEEVYEGHANGKSRLPKILKDVQAAGASAVKTLADTTGIDILRRRTGGGNSTDVSGIGVSVVDPVASLISATNYDALLLAYTPLGSQPSQNFIDVDVHGVVKNPFDLIDFVSGIDNADTSLSSGNKLATRAAKLIDTGSNQVIRNFTEVTSEDRIDVRARFGDRVGGGGATGEVHGVDLGIPELVDVASEAIAVGITGTSFNMAGDVGMAADIDNQGATVVTYPSAVQTDAQVIATTNAALILDPGQRTSAFKLGAQIALRSQDLGGEVDITEGNTVLGLGIQTVVGATVGSAGLTGENSVIDLGADALNRLTNIRYGTYQFGTLRIFNSINDAAPVAYVLHPDLLADLITAGN